MRLSVLVLLIIHTPALAQLNAGFSAVATTGCTPFNVQFTDNSAGSPSQWFWDFGNGQTSSLQSPLITFSTNGKYTVRLIVKNSTAEDYEEKTNYITVFATPDTKFSVSGGDSGCVSLQSSFNDNSDLFNASVKSWQWNFGDGGTSAQQNPAHTYTAEGRYDVSLTIETNQGCTSNDTIYSAIIAGNKPIPNFSASPLNGCAAIIRDFKNKSGNITASSWDFGDKGTSYDTDPNHHYRDTGYFTVKLLVSNNGCADSIKIKDYIHVDGPVAIFNKLVDCADRYTLTFRDISIDEITRSWDFGDGQTSTAKAPQHVYSAPGIYVVKLAITGAVCNDLLLDTLHIKTSNPVINISPLKDIYCRNDSILFSVTGYDDAVTKSFAWNFRDGFTTDYGKKLDLKDYVYKKNGVYKPEIYIKDDANCIDTTRFIGTIAINGPTADFQSTDSGCTKTQVNFKDKSEPGDNAPIIEWLWNYGDGATANGSGPLSYLYSFPVVYNANLTVTDINGCTDIITHPVQVFLSPEVDAGTDTFTCAKNNITLNPSGTSTYVWQSNADLSCTKCTNPVATPNQSAVYYVTGINSDGCSASDSVMVAVQTKEIISALPDSFSICESDSVGLNADGADSYTWSPANTLSNTGIKNPLAFPAANTAYTVIGKDSNNCFSDTAIVNVVVNPKPIVDIADSLVQLLKGSSYTIIASASNDAQNFEWLPATGLSCYNCLQPVATVDNDVTYTLSATNAFGCSNTDNITIITICTAESIYLPNTFSPNNDGMNDYFFPRSSQDISIRSLTIFNRWGQTVFQKRNFSSNNSAEGWDGKYKNNVQKPDVYIYLMELECSGKTFIEKGNISLMR